MIQFGLLIDKLTQIDDMKLIAIIALTALTISPSLKSAEDKAKLAFFDSLSELCGQRYEGQMTFPTEGQDSFAGKLLVAMIESCTDTEIRIPFHVGENRSRTWIVSKTDKGLQLKHDHRHEDGTPNEINMYGGLAGTSGSSLSQSFAADAHTAKIIPAASTNVWTMTLSEDASTFTYHLERHNAPRFTAQLTNVIEK